MTMTALPSSPANGSQTILLADYGPDTSGRTLGASVRDSVDVGVTEVVFDCAGVESMSPSFADELFGKLAAASARTRVHIVHADPAVLDVVRFAVRQRMAND
jgi:hypothetical protein